MDLVIKDKNRMFALLHILSQKVNKTPQNEIKKILSRFLWLRFKMMLNYEAWRQHISITELIKNAI